MRKLQAPYYSLAQSFANVVPLFLFLFLFVKRLLSNLNIMSLVENETTVDIESAGHVSAAPYKNFVIAGVNESMLSLMP